MKTLTFLVVLCAAAFIAAVSAYEESDLDASVTIQKVGSLEG